MLNHSIRDLFVRDLRSAAEEIDSYPSDESLWEVREGINNSGGNLGLHLAGNINHFFGSVLGSSDYERNRDLEFSSKGASREAVSDALRNAAGVVQDVLDSMSDEDLRNDFPEQFGGKTVSNAWMIAHLLTHLNYHLGQINYHRRLVG
ncbi:MAG: DUF1572 domain-containing protein [Acidobacteria bacterium]|nr:MAG: DUF1572 domain-containing protein [Acidobacteriota bacterium]REK01836.1 MAG: DUF1572 domain-containing protein [Acidobacteriota bacterium]REK14792.1 MAG: DUF1572 domain-containing protein [Acidobacteriota bacterium]REK45507.1 MAG: DUF1572 domain-containing protein [Acidobacteriota bacterium]